MAGTAGGPSAEGGVRGGGSSVRPAVVPGRFRWGRCRRRVWSWGRERSGNTGGGGAGGGQPLGATVVVGSGKCEAAGVGGHPPTDAPLLARQACHDWRAQDEQPHT